MRQQGLGGDENYLNSSAGKQVRSAGQTTRHEGKHMIRDQRKVRQHFKINLETQDMKACCRRNCNV